MSRAPLIRRGSAFALALGLAGVTPGQSQQELRELDPAFSPTSYIEQGKLLAFVVSVRTTRARRGRTYMPLEIGIVNKNVKRGLTVNLESFTLVDEAGNRYSAVGWRELRSSYRTVDADFRLEELPSLLEGQFPGYQRVPSALTKVREDKPAPRELYLPILRYAVDYIYFPVPDTGVVGHGFELFMKTPELEDAVFVRFLVKPPRRRAEDR